MIICDGFIYRYGGVRILQTFDTNGNVEKHIGQVLTNRNPHFRGAGDNHEHYIHMYEIDSILFI